MITNLFHGNPTFILIHKTFLLSNSTTILSYFHIFLNTIICVLTSFTTNNYYLLLFNTILMFLCTKMPPFVVDYY
nr:MAG TPA: hypothetical protein [Caudoviricetes sp.]